MRAGKCTKCDGHDVIYVPKLTDQLGDWSPAALAVHVEDTGMTGPKPPSGILEVYICRACGFTELYTRDPKSIPINRIPGAKVVPFNESYR